MLLDHAGIAARIPHHGSMCLLDGVEKWDTTRICCVAHSHRLADNPLRANGALGIINGIEYAAQACAVHGALLTSGDSTPTVGFLTSVREVLWTVDRLDTILCPLKIDAERLIDGEAAVIVQFSLRAAGQMLISGRASVLLDARGR